MRPVTLTLCLLASLTALPAAAGAQSPSAASASPATATPSGIPGASGPAIPDPYASWQTFSLGETAIIVRLPMNWQTVPGTSLLDARAPDGSLIAASVQALPTGQADFAALVAGQVSALTAAFGTPVSTTPLIGLRGGLARLDQAVTPGSGQISSRYVFAPCGPNFTVLALTAGGPDVIAAPAAWDQVAAAADSCPVAGSVPGPAAPPVPLTRKELRAAYTAAVKPYNKAAFALDCQRGTWGEQRGAWRRDATASRRFAKAVKAIPWPADVRADAAKLVRASTDEYTWAVQVARQRHAINAVASANAFYRAAERGTTAANAIRVAIGLRGVPRAPKC